jgi:hypothetical protein
MSLSWYLVCRYCWSFMVLLQPTILQHSINTQKVTMWYTSNTFWNGLDNHQFRKRSKVLQYSLFNPLNAELNPICHLLKLLGDLTFMGTCIISIFQYISNKMQVTQFIYILKLLYMFWVVFPPIIRSAYNCIYSIWYLLQCYCYLPLSWKSWNRFECAVGGIQIAVTVWQITDAVDTVVCASDDGWKYYLKHVEHFPDINKLCNVASCWIYEYIGILLGVHYILHISGIRVKHMNYFIKPLK